MVDYLRAGDLDQAIQCLAERPVTVIAGGTDIYPAHVGRPLQGPVLDISAIESLRRIDETDAHWRIGAAVTWRELQETTLPPCFDGLKQAAREVGGAQIQNRATIAGNLCNASPAADGVPPLLTLDASVELVSKAGRRTLPLSQFIVGNRRTERRPSELMTAVLIPKTAAEGQAYFLKLGSRRFLVISIVMVAVRLASDAAGNIAEAAVAVGACSEVALRLARLESDLVGAPKDPPLSERVQAHHLASLAPIADCRADAAYRQQAALVLVRRALQNMTVSEHAMRQNG